MVGKEEQINKMVGSDRNISSVGHGRKRERERKVGLVMTQKDIGHKQRLQAQGDGAK